MVREFNYKLLSLCLLEITSNLKGKRVGGTVSEGLLMGTGVMKACSRENKMILFSRLLLAQSPHSGTCPSTEVKGNSF